MKRPTILDRVEGAIVRRDLPPSRLIQVKAAVTNDPPAMTEPMYYRYHIGVELGIDHTTTSEGLPHAVDRVKLQLAHELYGDVIEELITLQNMIFDEGASYSSPSLEHIDKMIQTLRGK